MDYTARYGLEFNPFLKNSKEVFVETQEYKEVLFRLNYLLTTKGFGLLTGSAGRGKDHRCQKLGFRTFYFKVTKPYDNTRGLRIKQSDGKYVRFLYARTWSYVKKKYKLNVTNFLCSERSLTCYFYCILLDVFKILFLIFIWRQISTMTVNAYGIIKCFDVFKNQFMCMCIIKDFKPVDPFSLQKCMERFYTGVIPWICFL